MIPSSYRKARAVGFLILVLGLGCVRLERGSDRVGSAAAPAPARAESRPMAQVGLAGQAAAPLARADSDTVRLRIGTPGMEYDRQARLVAHRRTGETGWRRGEEIYYMRCWMCHSEYVIVADHFPAPSLRDLPGRLTEAVLRARIRSGAARMPSYPQESLSEQDLDDLVTFLVEMCGRYERGGGCFDEHNPPPNPFYQFEVTDLRRPLPRSAER